MMIEAMREVLRVADTQDIDLTEADIDYWLELLATLNPEGHTSMCQDVLAGRPTEVDLFAGTMLKIAKERGIFSSCEYVLYEKLKEFRKARGLRAVESMLSFGQRETKKHTTIMVIDGQGGKMGKGLVEQLKKLCPEDEILAIGTNSIATAAMLKAGRMPAPQGKTRR